MRHADVAVGDVILAGKDGQHARPAARRRGVDRDDVGVGMRGAHEYGMSLSWQTDVVGVVAGATDEPQILETRHGAADEWAALGGSLARCVID